MAYNLFEIISDGTIGTSTGGGNEFTNIEAIDGGYRVYWNANPGNWYRDFSLNGAPLGPETVGFFSGSRGGLFTVDDGQLYWLEQTGQQSFTVRAELAPTGSGPTGPMYSDPTNNGAPSFLDGTSANETVFLGSGDDTYASFDEDDFFGTLLHGGRDVVYGEAGDDQVELVNIDPDSGEPLDGGHFDGGAGMTDTLILIDRFAPDGYRLIAHGDTIVIRDPDFDDPSNLGRRIASIKDVEFIMRTAVSSLTVEDGFALRATTPPGGPAPSNVSAIRDFDGNDLGAGGDWRLLGSADVQYDNDAEWIYVNPTLGRWATVGPDVNGNINFANHGAGGDTRVVGIYIDPFVASGAVQEGSEFDSQQRFQDDLRSDSLELVDAFDFDADGSQEVYFRETDGDAYLRALMHPDGNIQYANYQNEQQVEDYLTDLGYDQSVVDAILV